jgi:hypothetical protein
VSTIVGITLVAMATSVGWAVRGEWGNWWGETVPGALAGMAVWLAFGSSMDAWQLIAFGAALALAHTVGGEISYGQIISYVVSRRSLLDRQKTDPDNRSPIYGLFALFLVGGMIGLFPSVALGLLFTDQTYGLADLSLWAVLATLGAILTYKLVVTGIGFRLSPPRYDFWAATLGGSLATMLFFWMYAGDMVVLRTGAIGWSGYGIGFAVGGLIHRKSCKAGSKLDSWKWMEHSVGLFGGLALGISAALMSEPLEPVPLTATWKLASLMVVFWFVPYLILSDVFEDWTFRIWKLGTPKSRSIHGDAVATDEPGWKRISSRRTFSIFHAISLASIPLFIFAVDYLKNSWDGLTWFRLPFVALLIFYVFVGILKFLPIQRNRAKLVTQGTFVVFVVACILLLQAL